MTGERPTIRELARLSGVSVGTVSRALNGYTDVNPDTRERIQRLARELDYSPAAAARTLVTQRSHLIGVFLETGEGHPDLQHPFFHEVLVGLKDRIGARGYDLLLFATERPGNGYGDHAYLKRARHHNVDGVALMGVDPADTELQRLLRSELACVGVDVELHGARTGYVMSDNIEGAKEAMRHLHALGHRRIATITGLLDKKPGADRLRGYRDACGELGLAYRDEYVIQGDFYFDAGHDGARRLLALDEPPTAIFAASDMTAIGVARGAAEAGVEVPGQLSVVGFDDIQMAQHVHPPLTTVRQAKSGLGGAAGDALLRQIDGSDSTEPVTLGVELIVRGSTAAAPTTAARR
jgi:LacI family transcriptional regulator